MENTKTSSSLSRQVLTVVSWIAVALTACIVTLMVIRSMQPTAICRLPATDTAYEPVRSYSNEVNWQPAQAIDVPGKEYTVKKTTEECYIYKTALTPQENRRMSRVPVALHSDMIKSLAGFVAVEYCEGMPVFLLTDVDDIIREKRQANATTPAGPTGGGAPAGPSSGDPYDIPYDESKNDNRCMDVVIDCGASVGSTTDCYTGVNGFFEMKHECISATKFKSTMPKPKGRILKHMQRQARICEQRRSEGQRC